MRFKNREEAGNLLAEEISNHLKLERDKVVIFAIPRGGVPVAYQISKKLKIPFSFVVTKKLAPLSDPEAAFGAIATDGTFMVDDTLKKYMAVSDEEFELVKEKALREAQEKKKRYISKEIDIKDKVAIVVDDGIATGYTAIVAGLYLRKKGAKEVILAVPVCPSDSYIRAKNYFDKVICYHKVDSTFFAVGAFYHDFHQVEDSELSDIIQKAKEEGLYLG